MTRPRVPNLFVVGAMKSGTTSLHRYLAQHPDVFMSEPKEPGYFVEELAWSRGRDWYLGLFADAGAAAVLGESSTHYAKLPTYQGVVERLHAFNPTARIVYVMRDPLERAVSHYWHNVRTLHVEAERRDPVSAVRDDPVYEAYGDYAMQLAPYRDAFGMDRIWTMTFESLVQDPAGELSRLLAWLQLEASVSPDAVSARWNARPTDLRQARGLGMLNRLRHSGGWARLARFVPAPVRRLGNRLADAPVTPDQKDHEAVFEFLRPRLQPRTRALEDLLERRFPEWTTLWARHGPAAPVRS